MASAWVIALAPLAALAANVGTQVAVFRVSPQRGLLRSELIGFAVGGAALLLIHALAGGAAADARESAALLFANALCYGALGYSYFHFGNLGETARRVRIVRELAASPDGLTLEEIIRRYDAREIFDRRLRRLTGTGQIVLRDGRYFIASPVLAAMARAVLLLKLLFLGSASEFEHGPRAGHRVD